MIPVLVVMGALLMGALAALAWCARGWRRAARETAGLRELATWRADQVSMLSHELRTPLTMIKLSGELLAQEDVRAPQARFVATIRQQADAAIELAEDMLTSARIESGRFEVHLEACDIGALIIALVNDLRDIRGASIVLDCSGSPCRVFADKLLVRQAVANLINNALTVSPPDRPVTVRVAQREFDILVSVTDEGTGISAQQRLALFQRFASEHRLRAGTGLGLIITKQIVERHGGRLFVDTVAQRGTVMMFNLPINGPAA